MNGRLKMCCILKLCLYSKLQLQPKTLHEVYFRPSQSERSEPLTSCFCHKKTRCAITRSKDNCKACSRATPCQTQRCREKGSRDALNYSSSFKIVQWTLGANSVSFRKFSSSRISSSLRLFTSFFLPSLHSRIDSSTFISRRYPYRYSYAFRSRISPFRCRYCSRSCR